MHNIMGHKWRLHQLPGLHSCKAALCVNGVQVMGPVVADPKQIGYGKLYCLILDTAKPFIRHVLKVGPLLLSFTLTRLPMLWSSAIKSM